jgi:hypothetical protein
MTWTSEKNYQPDPFEIEAQLESAIAEVSATLFGPNRIYLSIKKLIGGKGKTNNIPDGYLLDLTSRKEPRLFVVENELASHDPLNHIAVQILEFSLSFETSPLKLKAILKDALKANKKALKICESYSLDNGYENVDYLLESIISKPNAFNALVIIDALEEELETLLLSRFKFPVEILTIQRFKTPDGQRAYHFQPFLADVAATSGPRAKKGQPSGTRIDPADIDTIVVPAQEDGFDETFIAENCWYQIRIHASMIPKIKYIAAYRVSPVSAITHYAPVKDIRLWEDTSKYILHFDEPAKEIDPVKLVPKGSVKALQGPRYTSLKKLLKAESLDQAF